MFAMRASGSLTNVLVPLDRLASGGATQAGCYAINHTVAKAETQVKRALVGQSGLKYGEVGKELQRLSASPATMAAKIAARGGYHRLSEFGARQTSAGVTAAPWGVRRLFPHTFIVARFSGGVFVRKGRGRFPLHQLWGPAIPKEMIKGASLSAWDRTIGTDLPARMAHEWARLMGG